MQKNVKLFSTQQIDLVLMLHFFNLFIKTWNDVLVFDFWDHETDEFLWFQDFWSEKMKNFIKFFKEMVWVEFFFRKNHTKVYLLEPLSYFVKDV